ncbi:YycH family regulatory protein [Paenibacillus sp. J22TS3]|uniref:YycH family regulatory protein n=1 Tax=Paenibacillus sp. J22TS3 TaxID=2807192 RepID=UPI001AFDA339|nr:two-component system activity regulator YycH [Paenibacillus sp. J22TS3]GIP22344.1 two-component system WalR/WalK regulatory protein YycH [Paenibacillus sp. J22TS3]
MKETVKSTVLLLLILCSLIQSYFLIYRLPGNNPVVKSESDYVKTDNMGAEMKAEELVYPAEMIMHMGNGKHTIFYPGSTFYKLINSRLQGRLFAGFQRYDTSGMNWNTIRKQNEGIELRFGAGVPVAMLQKVMQISNDLMLQEETINRILIYNVKSEDKVRAFFFSSRGGAVYEAKNADLTVQDVRQHVGFGKEWTPSYTLMDSGYYVPDTKIGAFEVTLKTGVFTTDQMQKSLFADPSITRNIREKDGSEIYTDIKRSLQFKQNQNWINYTDPAASGGTDNNIGKNALSAVEFVNQHGGWDNAAGSSYRMEVTSEAEFSGDSKRRQDLVTFQQYYKSLPILDLDTFHYGVLRLDMHQGMVTSYERSLIYTRSMDMSKTVKRQLPGGKELAALVNKAAKDRTVSWLYPAYQPFLTGEELQLQPVWVLVFSSGEKQILQQGF